MVEVIDIFKENSERGMRDLADQPDCVFDTLENLLK